MAKNPDQFDTFFTPERREYYRDLHVRFPLWCGRWPAKEATVPDSIPWMRTPAIVDVLREDRRPYAGITFSEASEGQVPAPIYHIWDDSVSAPPDADPVVKQTGETDPPVLGLIAAAGNYLFCPWGTTLPKYGDQRQKSEAELATVLLDSLSDPHAQLWRLRDRFLRARTADSRAQARAMLLGEWVSLGHRMGFTPSQQGGAVCKLSDETLCSLEEQGMALIRELIEYSPRDTDRQLLRALANAEGRIGIRDRELLSRFRSQIENGEDVDPTRVLGLESRMDAAVDMEVLSRRVRFPMFSKEEIERILVESEGKVSVRFVRRAIRSIISGRLPIDLKTLRNRLSRC